MAWQAAIFGSSPGPALIRGLVVGAVLLVGARTVAVPVRATGISMLPTYHEGQLLFFNRLAYGFGAPRRGDIVAIMLDGGGAVLVKRVIGLPGERVRISAGIVYINDEPLDEPYVRNRRPWDAGEAALGADECYVIGDNRSMAMRNHTFGIVLQPQIFARLLF
jgi:signal peptidase I